MTAVQIAVMIANGLASIISTLAAQFGHSNEEIALEIARALKAKMSTDTAWAEYEGKLP